MLFIRLLGGGLWLLLLIVNDFICVRYFQLFKVMLLNMFPFVTICYNFIVDMRPELVKVTSFGKKKLEKIFYALFIQLAMMFLSF